MATFDDFWCGFTRCAVWSSAAEGFLCTGEAPWEMLDEVWIEIPERIRKAWLDDCLAYVSNVEELLGAAWYARQDAGRLGHLMWLSLSGHGTSFEDDYGPADAKALTKLLSCICSDHSMLSGEIQSITERMVEDR